MKNNSDSALEPIGTKGGASPGALMIDEQGVLYLVKLGLPNINGKVVIENMNDVRSYTQKISEKSCEEQFYFNIAQKIGGDHFQVPETSLISMSPKIYAVTDGNENTKSAKRVFANKFKIHYEFGNVDEDINIEEILNFIESTKLIHIKSKIIEDFSNLNQSYNYEEILENPNKSLLTPKGLGAFFALSVCLGNSDCFGVKGDNVGFNTLTKKIIVVDGGNTSLTGAMVAKSIPASSNHTVWFSFDDLSEESKQEAKEAFLKFVILTPSELREMVSNRGELDVILGEEYINATVNKLQMQQQRVAKEFAHELGIHEEKSKLQDQIGLLCSSEGKRTPLKEITNSPSKKIQEDVIKENSPEKLRGEKRPSPTNIEKPTRKLVKPNLLLEVPFEFFANQENSALSNDIDGLSKSRSAEVSRSKSSVPSKPKNRTIY